VWRSFKNSARTDGLELGHWVKANTDPDAEYPFARYNAKSPDYSYSEDEYTKFLEDPEWTKEETDYLFNLIREYDSRFYIVNDRYDFPGGPPRSMEDLKDRYYSVCRKLIRNRTGDEASKPQLLSNFHFDKEREVMRKKYLLSLENRTPKELAEEEALYIELKRIEQNEKHFKQDRDRLLRTLLGAESGLPDLPIDEDGPLGDPKKRRRGIPSELDSPATPSSSLFASAIPRRAQSAKSAAEDALHCIQRTDGIMPAGTTTKTAHQAAYLRSFRVPYPKAAVAARVTQISGELGISLSRLVMPTRDTLMAHESLLETITSLVELKKVADRVDQEIRTAKMRLGMRESEPPAEGPMDVDEDGQAPDTPGEGRAHSVVSTRSGRSRKQTGTTNDRRSMSVSSVDTSATSTTRAGTKRQKLG
jgi:DNA methyltransferase 1-associated protein 1